MGQPGRISLGQAVTPRGLAVRPGYDCETKQDRTGQDRTGQDRTGQDRTGQDRTGQDRTGQDRTGQDRTGRARWKRRKLRVSLLIAVTRMPTAGVEAETNASIKTQDREYSVQII